MKKIIAMGAEAKIYREGNIIIKERKQKQYRHANIDTKLRKQRTRREAKIIEKLSNSLNCPKLIEMNDKQSIIKMSYVKGKLLKDTLNRLNFKHICFQLGKDIAIMHGKDIIHGDLTTSNIIINSNKLYYIDFGLSFFSKKVEDKAVELHLLRQALESKHHEIYNKAFEQVIKGYMIKSEDAKQVLLRFDKVEQRGRYKMKGQPQ